MRGASAGRDGRMPAALPIISRRSALMLGVLALAGCAAPAPGPSRPAPVPSTPTPTPSPTVATPPASTPHPTPSASAGPAAAEPADVIAELAGRPSRDFGLNLPGHLTHTNEGSVALTLDACGGPRGSGIDAALLETLRQHAVPATLFLNARWIDANPVQAAELVDDPLFALASHGARHLPLTVSGQAAYGIGGTASLAEVVDELTALDDWFLQHAGAVPTAMRPGTAFTDDVAVEAAARLGRTIAGFSVNGDAGATFSAAQVSASLRAAVPGDIVIAHMNRPGGGTAAGFADALPRMLDAGIVFATLPQGV